MPPKKSSATARSDVSFNKTIGDVMSKVYARINKSPKLQKRKSTKRLRKFGDLPHSDDSFDDSADSDYEPLTKKRKILTESRPDKSSGSKTSSKILNTKQRNSPYSRQPPKRRVVVYSSSDDENQPSSSLQKRKKFNGSKKCLLETLSKIKCPSNVETNSDAASTTSSVSAYFSKKKSAPVDFLAAKNMKFLKRPSLQRFRSSSFTENLDNVDIDDVDDSVSQQTERSLQQLIKESGNLKIEKAHICSGDNIWGEGIPVEVLSNIFRFAMLTEGGAVPFLLRMQLVCRLWRDVAKMPIIWSCIDADFQKKIKDSKQALTCLGTNIAFTKSLSLSRWSKLKLQEFETLLQNNSKCLSSLDLSFCSSLQPKQLLEHSLPNYCPNLTSLNLSYFCTVNTSLTSSLISYLELKGENLRCLYLNGNTVQRFQKFCETFKRSKTLSNVQILDISRLVCDTVQSSRTSILDFCQAFPSLTHLYMSDAIIGFSAINNLDFEAIDEIWPNLVHVEFVVKQPWWGFANNFQNLMKCLQKCLGLRRLYVSGNRIGQYLDLLADIPLNELDISHTSHISMTIGQTLKKWLPSLTSLDISWIKCLDVLPEMCKLLTPSKQSPRLPLRRLNLAGTPITIDRLKSVVLACPHLEYLDCSSCRSLPLGMKRAYEKGEIQSLVYKL